MLDITCGYEGFESYSKYGFICRVRQKGDKITLEVKNYFNKEECLNLISVSCCFPKLNAVL